MNTLTVKDLVYQLQQASPEARVAFKIECEDKNFDARLEFSRVTCLSPATEVVVTMADNTEDVRAHMERLEVENGFLSIKEKKLQRIESMVESMKWLFNSQEEKQT